MNCGVWLDLFLVILFVVTTYLGKRRGVVESLIKIIGVAAGLVLGVLFSSRLAEILSLTPLHDTIMKHIGNAVSTESLKFSNMIPGVVGTTLDNAAKATDRAIALYFTDVAIHVLAFLLIVLVTWLVSVIIRRAVSDERKKKSVVGFLDATAGMLVGAIKGVILVFLVLALVIPVCGLVSPEHVPLVTDAINTSIISKHLFDINPLLMFMKHLGI